jgi:hypothetical protein
MTAEAAVTTATGHSETTSGALLSPRLPIGWGSRPVAADPARLPPAAPLLARLGVLGVMHGEACDRDAGRGDACDR